MKKDRARIWTDRKLMSAEQRISKVYANDKRLKKAEKALNDYLNDVQDKTDKLYYDYTHEQDPKEKKRLKKEYSEKLKDLTMYSDGYNDIVQRFVEALVMANQKATDVVNDITSEVYAMNYNQMATDLKKVGLLK